MWRNHDPLTSWWSKLISNLRHRVWSKRTAIGPDDNYRMKSFLNVWIWHVSPFKILPCKTYLHFNSHNSIKPPPPLHPHITQTQFRIRTIQEILKDRYPVCAILPLNQNLGLDLSTFFNATPHDPTGKQGCYWLTKMVMSDPSDSDDTWHGTMGHMLSHCRVLGEPGGKAVMSLWMTGTLWNLRAHPLTHKGPSAVGSVWLCSGLPRFAKGNQGTIASLGKFWRPWQTLNNFF